MLEIDRNINYFFYQLKQNISLEEYIKQLLYRHAHNLKVSLNHIKDIQE